VFASRDWHPRETKHFRQYGGVWPVHCVRDTPGAAFHPALRLPPDAVVFSKGTDPERDSYSAFDGTTEEGTLLMERMVAGGINHLYIGGLATDYCVRATALEALLLGKKVTVLTDAVAGVDVTPGDSALALEAVRRAGAEFCLVADL
jgi:nicotinamidase/pyrazinamidase